MNPINYNAPVRALYNTALRSLLLLPAIDFTYGVTFENAVAGKFNTPFFPNILVTNSAWPLFSIYSAVSWMIGPKRVPSANSINNWFNDIRGFYFETS